VYGVVTEAVGATDTAGDLLGRLAASGAMLLAATVEVVANGMVARIIHFICLHLFVKPG